MCYRTQQEADLSKVEKVFGKVDQPDRLLVSAEINGFAYPATPIVVNEEPDLVQTSYSWGLVPFWAKDNSIRKNTLNAKIETIGELPSFRNAVKNRCLIIATGFYEWRWEDEKGKTKTKYLVRPTGQELFAFAGIYSNWKNPASGEQVGTYSILTTAANDVMEYVHNNKKRMPVVLKAGDHGAWINGEVPYQDFAFPNYSIELEAKPC